MVEVRESSFHLIKLGFFKEPCVCLVLDTLKLGYVDRRDQREPKKNIQFFFVYIFSELRKIIDVFIF